MIHRQIGIDAPDDRTPLLPVVQVVPVIFLQYFDAVGWVFWPVKLSPG